MHCAPGLKAKLQETGLQPSMLLSTASDDPGLDHTQERTEEGPRGLGGFGAEASPPGLPCVALSARLLTPLPSPLLLPWHRGI